MNRPTLALVAVVLLGRLCSAQQGPPPVQPPPGPASKVILSRSTGDSTQGPPVQPSNATPNPPAHPVTDEQRQSVTFLSYDIDLQLHPQQESLAAHARLLIRNDGPAPLELLPLQVSSSLSWVSIRIAGSAASFTQQTIKSDLDHTGALSEVAIRLPQALKPEETIQLEATYQGSAAASSVRPQQLGISPELARHADWDRVARDFAGLRGLGNVAWYPVSSVPVVLGDGARLFEELGEQKQRQSSASVALRVTAEYFGAAPNLAVLDDQIVPVRILSQPDGNLVPGIATCFLPATRLSFATPDVFLLQRNEVRASGVRLFVRDENATNSQPYLMALSAAAGRIQPWLGTAPRQPFTMIDLADERDAPYESGAVLFTGLHDATADQLEPLLVHPLTHAYFHSPWLWLQEGVAQFLSTVQLEQSHGREAALQQLDDDRSALALAEPAETGAGTGEPLLAAHRPVYYRTKSTYVLWMLRDIAGAEALGAALRAYDPAADGDGHGFEHALAKTSGKDLRWFFDDWVYRDRGLPDLSIAGVFPTSANLSGSYIVAVDVANDGSAEAMVPVSVRSDLTTVSERLRIPGRAKVSHRFLVQGTPQEVQVNDGDVPEMQASAHRQTISISSKQ